MLTVDEEPLVSGRTDGKIRLWSLSTGTPQGSMQEEPVLDEVDEITALAVSPDGAFLVSGSIHGVISVWDLKTRQKSRSFNFSSDPARNARIIALQLTKDLTRLMALTRTSARTYDFNSGRQTAAFDLLREKSGADTSFFRDSLVGDDALIAQFTAPGCDIAELRYFDRKDPGNPVTLDAPANCHGRDDDDYHFGEPSLFVDGTQSRLLIARSGVAEIRQWDIKTRSASTIKWADAVKPEIIGIDKEFAKVASNIDSHVSVRTLEGGADVSTFDTATYRADAAIMSRDGRSILMAQRTSDKKAQQVTLWEVGTRDPKTVVQVPADTDTTIRSLSPQAKLAAAIAKDSYVLFSLDTGKELRRFTPKEIKTPWSIRLSPDGRLALLLGDGPDDETVPVLVDMSDGRIKRRLDEEKKKTNGEKEDDFARRTDITDAAFSPDGKRLALGRFNGTVDIWDTASLRRVKQLPAFRGESVDRIWSLAFTSDGKRLISGSRDSGAFLWTIDTGKPPRAFLYDDMATMHPYLASVALSHDGSTLVAGSSQHAVSSGDGRRERSIKVWNAENGKRRAGWLAHEESVAVVTFSPDDHHLVSTSRDGTIKCWDTATGKQAATIIVTNDGRWIVLSAGGLFSGHAGEASLFNLIRGLSARPASDFHEQLYKPDLIAELLKGDPHHRYAAAAKQLDLKKIWDGAAQ